MKKCRDAGYVTAMISASLEDELYDYFSNAAGNLKVRVHVER
jgi:hypothetical protein